MLQDFSSVSDHFMTLGQFISGQFSLQMCSCLGKGVLKLCSKFSGEYRCLKVIYNFIEITFWNGCSPANFCIEMEEDLWKRPFELRAETSTQEEILTIRSRNCKSSCWQIFNKISVLKIFQHSQKTPVLEFLFKKVAGFEARKSIKRRLQHRFFPVNIAKFLKTAFSIEQLWWLLLELRHFFILWYITLKFMNIAWHKHNLMISFSVSSGPLDMYSYEIPLEYL